MPRRTERPYNHNTNAAVGTVKTALQIRMNATTAMTCSLPNIQHIMRQNWL